MDSFDRLLIQTMHKWGIPLLRISLGIVFLWFGLLKIFGESPVAKLVGETYYFLPKDSFLLILGVWETLIGLGLLFKIKLRLTLFLLWLQMLGTLIALILASNMFFKNGNIFLLTTEGEFVVKNFVLIASGIVIGGYELRPRS